MESARASEREQGSQGSRTESRLASESRHPRTKYLPTRSVYSFYNNLLYHYLPAPLKPPHRHPQHPRQHPPPHTHPHSLRKPRISLLVRRQVSRCSTKPSFDGGVTSCGAVVDENVRLSAGFEVVELRGKRLVLAERRAEEGQVRRQRGRWRSKEGDAREGGRRDREGMEGRKEGREEERTQVIALRAGNIVAVSFEVSCTNHVALMYSSSVSFAPAPGACEIGRAHV